MTFFFLSQKELYKAPSSSHKALFSSVTTVFVFFLNISASSGLTWGGLLRALASLLVGGLRVGRCPLATLSHCLLVSPENSTGVRAKRTEVPCWLYF